MVPKDRVLVDEERARLAAPRPFAHGQGRRLGVPESGEFHAPSPDVEAAVCARSWCGRRHEHGDQKDALHPNRRARPPSILSDGRRPTMASMSTPRGRYRARGGGAALAVTPMPARNPERCRCQEAAKGDVLGGVGAAWCHGINGGQVARRGETRPNMITTLSSCWRRGAHRST